MPGFAAESFDCVLTDLPYGTTANKWDSVLPLAKLWPAWKRLLRPGAPVILFTQQPFTTTVAASNLGELRTEWIWKKAQGTGFLNAARYPLKNHENILVFCEKKPPYYPQKSTGNKPYSVPQGSRASTNYGKFNAQPSKNEDGSRFPLTVLTYQHERTDRRLHPTQKPLALCEYLIRTYTMPGQAVLDCCAGSSTTLIAAINTGRDAVGIEHDAEYHASGLTRIKDAERLAGGVVSLSASAETVDEYILLSQT